MTDEREFSLFSLGLRVSNFCYFLIFVGLLGCFTLHSSLACSLELITWSVEAMGDGEPRGQRPRAQPRGDCRLGYWPLGHWFQKKIKKLQKKSGYRAPVWVKSPIRTRTDNPIKLSIRVSEPKKLNISVWVPGKLVQVPKNLVRHRIFGFGSFWTPLVLCFVYVCWCCLALCLLVMS